MLRLRERWKVLGSKRAYVEDRRTGDDLHILLGWAQFDRYLSRREDDDSFPSDVRLKRHAESDVHVRRSKLTRVCSGDKLNA